MARVKLRDPPSRSSKRSWVQQTRRRLGKVLLDSHRIPPLKPNSALSNLPIRFRPAFIVLTFLVFIPLSLLGVHPNLSGAVPVNDKVQHFIGLGLATGLFYWIWEVEESSRRIWMWRLFPELVSAFVCFLIGGVFSECIQSLLPYKTFQIGDVIANLLGSSLGLFIARSLARKLRHRRELARLYQPLDEFESETELDEESRLRGTSPIPEMAETPTIDNDENDQSHGAHRTHNRRKSNPWDDQESGSEGEGPIFALGDDEELKSLK